MNVRDRYGMTKPFSLFLNSITAIVKVFCSGDFRKEFIKNEIMIIVPGGHTKYIQATDVCWMHRSRG